MITAAVRASAPTAAGLDSWSPAEFRVLKGAPADWLAKLLQAIEGGTQWPEPVSYTHLTLPTICSV
eukprot:15377962-Alexandrium_andersonii.AAC.1